MIFYPSGVLLISLGSIPRRLRRASTAVWLFQVNTPLLAAGMIYLVGTTFKKRIKSKE